MTAEDCLARLLNWVNGNRDALARDTLATIRTVFGVPVKERPEHRPDGICAVDGSYFHGPPRIIVAAAVEPRRTLFTALHELAHHLIRHDWELFGLAVSRGLEEDVCNRFAAEILLPSDLVRSLLTRPMPTAEDFAAIYEQSHASRAVCARRVAEFLPRLGHAVVALGTTSTYCASAHTTFRSAFGVEQGVDSIFAAAVRDGVARGPARLMYRDDFVSPPFWADAVCRDDHVFAIFTEYDDSP